MEKLNTIKTKEQRQAEERKNKENIDTVRSIMKNENPYEVTEDAEYFIIHLPNKNRHIPKKQTIPLIRQNGVTSDIKASVFAHALASFPEDTILDAVEKYEKEHPEIK